MIKLAKPLLRVACIVVAAILLPGCVYTNVTTAKGAKMTRVSLFGDQRAQKVDLDEGKLSGYSSEQAQAAGAIAEGVARGLAK